ncbi:NAD-dependent epimerase/dehydratase family protein [Neolewinella aurantiaca]|uniref:NAD-dependent epimerase/dehydratase family protein n=1 Tax=Neolewinella aurantiaca TaxID=2602767 RepID=A0A5C7FW27_9BACT|nr:NAD-dependent epimerase/dehydratase family protein [Neolewinella aurantiaca]TXF89050.1 NAD-dependent epimerase/dehydratase family protein [Neolewinella aurantiaca]
MKTIITGATGMVGKGALLECIDDSRVEEILLITRSSVGVSHPKVKEVLHKDFRDFTGIESQFHGYDACFHCMGVSSAGMSEEQYTEITYTMTEALVATLHSINSGMVFIYVSGDGTDETETSSTMWARVKGKTENMVLDRGFKDAYAFRPGAILPERGIESGTRLYNAIYFITRPLFPLMKHIKSVTTTSKLGKAMINVYHYPQTLKRPRGGDINEIAEADAPQ